MSSLGKFAQAVILSALVFATAALAGVAAFHGFMLLWSLYAGPLASVVGRDAVVAFVLLAWPFPYIAVALICGILAVVWLFRMPEW